MAKKISPHWPSRLSKAAAGIVGGAKAIARSFLGNAHYERLKQAREATATAISVGIEKRARLAQAAWQDGDPTEAERIWQALAAEQPLAPEWPVKLALAADAHADYDGAKRILDDAWNRGARDPHVDERIAFYKRWNRFSNTAVQDAIDFIDDPNASPLKLSRAAFYLLSNGILAPARAGFRKVSDHPRIMGFARTQFTALDILEGEVAAGRTIINGWLAPGRDAIMIREPGADTTVIVFTTMFGDFGMPVNALHALIQPAKVNAIYLFDERRLFNLGGSATFGRPYPAMLEGLRRQLDAWGTHTLVALGFSGGGFTALRTALDLGAQGAICFSPVTTMYRPAGGQMARSQDDKVPDGEMHMAYAEAYLRQCIPDMMTNLRDALATRSVCPRIQIHRGTVPTDIFHSYNVMDLPGVTIDEIAGYARHETLSELVRRGRGDLFVRFIESLRDSRSG